MKKYFTLLLIMIFASITTMAQGYKAGDTAIDFKLKNVDSKMVSTTDYKDAKGLLVIFSCNPCPYVVAYQKRMIDLHNKYAPLGYPVIAINTNDPVASPQDTFEKMQARAKEQNFPFPYLEDAGQNITKTYGAKATPHLFVLQKVGDKFEVAYTGAIDDDTENVNPNKIKYAENAIDALLKGEKPSITQTKAIGCSIKWKKI
jgi:peroxiredoxin